MTKGEGKRRRRRGYGIAFLVGAGPGDPDLITVRGRDLLAAADAIIYDALANPELMKQALRSATNNIELHDVGKRGGDAEGSARQESINDLLVRLVKQGKNVVRLKGGDPLVFGRGGEEAQALSDAGLPFEIVPGITAGIAAPAYAGIPVTHRGLATAVTFVTGHEDPMKGAPTTDWGALARGGGTIVLYMGVRKLGAVTEALMKGGMQTEMPAAVIEWGTLGRQRTVVGTVATIADDVVREEIGAPAIAVIGWTVVLRDEIAWFDRRPLFGKRILVTRAGESASATGLGSRLRAAGAEVVETAATRIVTLDRENLRQTLTQLNEYQWIVFTSGNAVDIFWDALLHNGRDSRALAGLKVAAIGPATADTLGKHGIKAEVQPSRFAAEGLIEALRERDDIRGARVLYPCAEGARDTLQKGIEKLGAQVHRIHSYRSAPDRENAELLRAEVDSGRLSLVAFTSASAVKAYAAAVGGDLRSRVPAASIGPVTSNELRDAGIIIAVEAEESTLDGLVRAIVAMEGDTETLLDAGFEEDVENGDLISPDDS